MVIRSHSYVSTVINDEAGLAAVALVRSTTKKCNVANKIAGNPMRYRVVVHGRLGRGNPNADLYPCRGSLLERIRPEHSTRFDIYIFAR